MQIVHNDHNNFNAACKVSNQTTPSKISCHLYDLFIGLQKKKEKIICDTNKNKTRTQITEQGQKHEPGQNTKKKIWIG